MRDVRNYRYWLTAGAVLAVVGGYAVVVGLSMFAEIGEWE